jgi:hypothetical protein
MAKPKKEKFPYKELKIEEFNELRAKADGDLLKDHLFESKAIQVIAKKQKDDKDLQDLRRQLKEHREGDDDLVKAKSAVIEAREACDDDKDIKPVIEEKKAKESGYRGDKVIHRERVKAIQFILEGRKMSRPS